MNLQDIAYQVSTTLGDHAADYDIDAIAEEIQTQYGPASIDDVPNDEYWQIVERHDTTAADVDEHTALVGTSASTVAADHCDVEVIKEVGIGSPVLKTDLPVRVDDDDKLVKVEGAADEALAAAGWKRTSPWEVETDGLRATVTRA